MIKNFTLLLFIFVSFTLHAQNINIPDANFKKALVDNTNINTNGDSEISEDEAEAYTGAISADSRQITDVTGIEHFVNITGLWLRYNKLTSLDLSNNLKITVLHCFSNELRSLNLGNNTEIRYLTCYYNQLTSLDLSKNTALTTLKCNDNQLTQLDLSNNTALTTLECDDNQLTSLDLSNNTEITRLECRKNRLKTLDLSNNTKITNLHCENNQLSSLNLNNITNIFAVYCNNNQLSSINLSDNTEIFALYCFHNKLSSLDLKNNTKLQILYCYSNQLSSLDLESNTTITDLYCYDNKLTSLTLSENNSLSNLKCNNNNFLFSGLKKIKDSYSDLSYSSWHKLFSLINETDGYIIEYSSEVEVSNVNTIFTWYDLDNNIVDESFISKVEDGIFKFLQTGIFRCKMTNTTFPTIELETEAIAINKNSIIDIPDANFKNALLSKVSLDINKDDEISEAEAALCTGQLGVSNQGIADLTGIEHFINITSLVCSNNMLSDLDLCQNNKLRSLDCGYNQLTKLDISCLPELTRLTCRNNKLTSIDPSHNVKLIDFYCDDNMLRELDISKNSNLISFYCRENLFPFSELEKIKNNFSRLDHRSSKKIFSPIENFIGYTVDYSSEVLIADKNTTFTWFDPSYYIIGSEIVTEKEPGVFQFSKPGIFYCSMTNPEFQGLDLRTNKVTIRKKDQSITINTSPEKAYVLDALLLNATASSGLDVSFNVISGNASISDNTITFNKEGTIEIKAIQLGNDEFSASEKSFNIQVEKKTQTITFNTLPDKVNVKDVIEIGASASSGLETSFDIISGDASINENKITFNKEGVVEVKATQLGNDEFSASEKSFNIQVEKKTQTITFNTLPDKVNVKDVIEIGASASSGLATSIDIVSGDASINDNKITFNKEGVVTIKALQAGNIEYNSVEIISEITVSKKNQSIAFSDTPTSSKVKDVITLNTNCSSSLPVSYSIISGIADINEDQLICTQAGILKIKAFQAGNIEFNPTETIFEITVSKKNQSITFTDAPSSAKVNDIITLKTNCSSSLPVSYSIISGTANINEDQLICTQAGVLKIKVTQTGNIEFNPTETIFEITVSKKNQSITFSDTPASSKVKDVITLNTNCSSSLPVSYSIISGIADIIEDQLICKQAGILKIKALQTGNIEFNPTEAIFEITVSKKDQSITFTGVPSSAKVNDVIKLEANASSALPVNYSIVSGTANVSGDLLTPTSEGTIQVKATQGGNDEFNPTVTIISIAISKKDQSITFTDTPSSAKVNDVIKLEGNASSTLSVNYSIVSGIANLSGDQLTCTSEGTIQVKATQTGNIEFNPTVTIISIAISKKDQSITFTDAPSSAKVNDVITLEANASSTLPVSYSIVSGTANQSGDQLTCTSEGTIQIKATQSGNDEFNPTVTIISIVISKKDQSITFTDAPSSAKVNDVITLEANASSTLPVSYSIVSGTANQSGDQLTCTSEGTIQIKATQGGNDEFNPTVTIIEISVSKKDQFITYNDIHSEVEVSEEIDLDVTNSSGLDVSYIIVKGNASISGNKIAFNEVGNVIIKAINAGNDEYNETEQSHLFIVRKKEQDISVDNVPSQVTINESLDLSISASSGLDIELEVVSGTANLTGTIVSFTEVGEVKIKASQTGNSVYKPTETTFAINIVKKDQTLNLQNISSSVLINETLELIATASSNLPVNFSIISGDAELLGNSITFTNVGTVIIKAKQIGNEEFNSVEQTIEFTVAKKTQTISFVNAPKTGKVNDVIVLKATSSSNLDLVFKLLEGNASINGNELTCTKSGTVKVKASQVGNDEYESTEAITEITVSRRIQTIDFTNTPETVKINEEIELSTAASSNLEVTFELISGGAILSGDSVEFNEVGIVEIKAIQTGNDEYEACEKTIKITVDFATGIDDVIETKTQIYPNPVETEMLIKFTNSEARTIRIFNLLGRLKLQKETASSSERINLSDFKSGLYLMKVQSASGSFTHKILKK